MQRTCTLPPAATTTAVTLLKSESESPEFRTINANGTPLSIKRGKNESTTREEEFRSVFRSAHGTASIKGGMSSTDAAVEDVVNAQLCAVKELDEDVFAYILGIVKDVDAHGCDPETLGETVRRDAERPYRRTLVDRTREEREETDPRYFPCRYASLCIAAASCAVALVGNSAGVLADNAETIFTYTLASIGFFL